MSSSSHHTVLRKWQILQNIKITGLKVTHDMVHYSLQTGKMQNIFFSSHFLFPFPSHSSKTWMKLKIISSSSDEMILITQTLYLHFIIKWMNLIEIFIIMLIGFRYNISCGPRLTIRGNVSTFFNSCHKSLLNAKIIS